jgi:hypothetical protein
MPGVIVGIHGTKKVHITAYSLKYGGPGKQEISHGLNITPIISFNKPW